MKTKLLLIAVILLLSSPPLLKAQTAYEWDYVNTLQNEWLQKICTQGLDTVYVVGNNGLIAQSPDRALTWNKQYLVTSQLNDIIFCNHNTGFAVGNNGTILKTTDAGTTWTPKMSGTTNNLNAIAATGVDNIWAVGDSGIVLYSQNMGNEWSLEPIINRRANLNDIDFRNNKGFIVGDSTVVLKTINKGNSWTDNSLTSAESLYSLSLSENKVFVLRGYKPINYHYDNLSMVLSANENGNFEATNWPWNHGLVLLNDSLCIISAYMIPTGAPPVSKSLSSQNEANSYNGLQIYSCFLNKGFCIQSSFFYPSFGPSYSQYTGFPFSLCFANDSTGYFISGQLLLKTPSLLGAGIHDNKYNSNVKIIQIENELRVSSIDNKISRVEIINLNGAILNNNDHLNADNMIKINTANLVHGAYIIRVLFSDGSFYNSKWIKL